MRPGNVLTGDGVAIDVPKLIDRLEDMVEGSRHFMNKAWGIDLEEFYILTNKIKASLPDDVRKATRLTKDSQRIVDEAKLEAEQILERAKKEAERAVSEARSEAERLKDNHEISRMATAQAKELLAQAEEGAKEMRRGADEYALDVLTRLETEVATMMRTIQKGREKLERDVR
jgi:regulator of protease activity HflC (stomatin/prohibitin superfamily)